MKIVLVVFAALLIVLILGIGLTRPPRVPRDMEDVAEFESYLDKLVRTQNPPGISVSVVKDGAVVYSYAAGYVDPAQTQAATEDTVYHWWSMTKVPTAIVIMQLAEAGELQLDDPVTKYLDFFAVEYKGEPVEDITIRQLLRHSSGIPEVMPAMIGWVHHEDEIYNQTEELRKILPDYNELKFAPDSKAAYTNLGYLVLGAVIESVTEMSYEDAIQQYVLTPAGMDNTGFLYSETMAENEAMGSHPFVSIYTPLLPSLLDMDTLVQEKVGTTSWFNRLYIDVTPPTGLIGSTADVSKLMMAYLAGDQLLSEESHLAMLPTDEGPTTRALGWAEFGMDGRAWVQHRGGGPGFATIMRLYPEEELGIVIMANGTHMPDVAMVEALAELFAD